MGTRCSKPLESERDSHNSTQGISISGFLSRDSKRASYREDEQEMIDERRSGHGRNHNQTSLVNASSSASMSNDDNNYNNHVAYNVRSSYNRRSQQYHDQSCSSASSFRENPLLAMPAPTNGGGVGRNGTLVRPGSLVRVGSLVVRQSRNKRKMHRASDYNHVHQAAMHNLLGGEENVSDSQSSGISQGKNGFPKGTVGLMNLGNTCFLNSSIQCLSATIPLTDYFLGYEYRSEINKSNFLGTGGKLVTAYAELLKEMWLGQKAIVRPIAFKRQLGKFAPQFSGTCQHDAQELLSFLLDGIHEDLNRVKKKPYIQDRDYDGTNDNDDSIESWKNYLQRDKSLVVDLFQGQLRNTCQCEYCGHKNIRFEPFMYLSLPISNSCRSLQDCLDLYLETDELTNGNRWYCEKCKKHRDATKKTDLWILPPILIIHLKRFKYDEYGHSGWKNKASIRFPIEQWDLSNQLQSSGGLYPLYDLYAVSNHVGGLGSGHYTAFALNRFDDQWYEFNDSIPKQIRTNKVIEKGSSAGYVLFYNRSNETQNYTMIRRQSVSRPDLWPHQQSQPSATGKSSSNAAAASSSRRKHVSSSSNRQRNSNGNNRDDNDDSYNSEFRQYKRAPSSKRTSSTVTAVHGRQYKDSDSRRR